MRLNTRDKFAHISLQRLRSFHEVDFDEMKTPFYIKQEIKKEFSEVVLPAIQIDYIHITDQLKPDFSQSETFPEQSPLDESGLTKPEFQFDKVLTANVFKTGFNFHAP